MPPSSQAARLPARLRASIAAARRGAHIVGARLSSAPFLWRWLVLASMIGVIAGLGAVAFYASLALATHLLLGGLAGYQIPTPAGEGNLAGSAHYARPWAIPLVVALGGLLSGLLVFTFAPEAEGHGTDAAINAVHHDPRGIRLRAVIVKIVASALTIGSGGSGGREGPTAQISAGFGSLLARILDLSPEDGRIAVSVGIGSGIGAIFSAPLGGAVLAADIVYREDFEFAALIPGLWASVVAFAIFGAFYGYQPLFAFGPAYQFQAAQIPWFALIGLLAGGIGLLYSQGFYRTVALSRRMKLSPKLRPALGGLAVGLIALALPEVLGTGYGWVQKSLADQLLHTPLYVVLALPLARILATALSIGTGGSGGVFGPGMVIGAFTGLAVWRVLAPIAPAVGHDPAPYVVVGMMAVFGGISRAPLAVMLMVAQMTASAAALVPALIAVSIATLIVSRAGDSIYRSQLRNREESPAARPRSAMLLGGVAAGAIARPARVLLTEGMSAVQAVERLRAAGVPGAPVVDARGVYRGAVSQRTLLQRLRSAPEALVEEALDARGMAVGVGEGAGAVLDFLTQAAAPWLTVIDSDGRVVGVLGIADLVAAHRRALDRGLAQLAAGTAGTAGAVPVRAIVGEDSPLVGVALRRAKLPPGCILLSVRRGEQLLFPSGATELVAGDVVNALSDHRHAAQLKRMLSGRRDRSQAPPLSRPRETDRR
jgi:CIC family chloride channel protein